MSIFFATRQTSGGTEWARGRVSNGVAHGVFLFANGTADLRAHEFRTSSAEFGSCGWRTVAPETVPLDVQVLLGEVPEFTVKVGHADALESDLDTVRDALVVWAASMPTGTRQQVADRLRSLAALVDG